MGVPSFYRWLVKKYPNVVVEAIEDKGECIDTSKPNPNGLEFDNLFLDMNGIIHPCFHPDDHPSPPTTFEEVFNNVFDYIDHLFSIVRPRKLLYMAIDGVAPRAKMNQQRSRRFQTAKDNEIAEAEEESLRRQFEMEGKQVIPKQESEVSDSNVITPGTEFMYVLSKKLQIYINSRMNIDPGWKNIKVILSDANVPGEGEHKIMSFIRLQRNLPDYNPNSRHCLYGLDADLIMLALATHEVHFSILREDVLIQEQQPICEPAPETSLCRQESYSVKSRGCFKDFSMEGGWFKDAKTIHKNSSLIKKPYKFLHVWILREYLELDMIISDPPENFKFDVERIIDDFTFICFFAGNDFLPHMPTLEIHEGAIDLMMTVYKEHFKNLGGYLVDMQRIGDQKAGYVKLKRVGKFILLVGTYEEKIFKRRSELRERKLRKLYVYSDSQDRKEYEGENSDLDKINGSCTFLNGKSSNYKDSTTISVKNLPSSRRTAERLPADNIEILKNTKELKEKLKNNLQQKSDLFKNGGLGADKVRLETVGWKERYYKEKFSAESPIEIESTRKKIIQKYTEGLLWVLQYYFSGVPSWTWFYPYHYGPFASDFKGLAQVKVNFQTGSPFKPFDQLMGVLPPRSAHALPKAYQTLMTDNNSNIVDFYDTEFEIDTDGKRFAWQGICKLSFIEEERLLTETRKLEKELTKHEEERNTEKVDLLFLRRSSNFGLQLWSLIPKRLSGKQKELIKIDSSVSGEIGGFIRHCDEDITKVDSTCSEKPQNDNVLCVLFQLPNGSLHIPRPLEGVEYPLKTISEADIEETQLWHEYQGSRPNTRFQSQERFRNANRGGNFASNSSAEWLCSGNSAKFSSKSSSEVIHKGADYGWGAGRGNNSREHNGASRGVTVSNSSLGCSSWGGRKENGQPFVSNGNSNMPATFHRTSASNERWKVVGSSQGEARGIDDLKISESGQSFRKYERVHDANNSFCPSSNGSTNNTNLSWRQVLLSDTNPSVQSRGRGQWSTSDNSNSTWQHNTHRATNTSGQAHGRGHFVTTSVTKLNTGETKQNPAMENP